MQDDTLFYSILCQRTNKTQTLQLWSTDPPAVRVRK